MTRNSRRAALALLAMMTPLARGELVVSYQSDDEDLAMRLEAGDWSDAAETPSIITVSGGLTREGGSDTLLYSGWGTSIDVNKRVGFQITAKPGYRLYFSELANFNSGGGRQAVIGLSSWCWGYRVDNNKDGVFEQGWTFGKTYTPAADGDNFKESESFKTWDFPDFSTKGTVEFAIFASAPTPIGQLLAFGGKISVNGVRATPAGYLGAYTHAGSYNIPVSEASGVAYNPDTDTLFAIGDEGYELVELSKTGVKLSSMPFDQNGVRDVRAFDDPESVTWLGGGKFAISDERRNMAVVTTYNPATTPNHAQLSATSYAFGAYDSNTGLEGISYDPVNQSMWGIRELGPVKIYEMRDFPGVQAGAQPQVQEPIARKRITRMDSTQFSDIYVMAKSSYFAATDPRRLNILLLARDARKIIEITRDGLVVDTLDLNFLGRSTIEGITMDNQGKIYLVSEQVNGLFQPQLHVFNPGPAAVPQTPEQAFAFQQYAGALRGFGLVPGLALQSPELAAAITATRGQGRADVLASPADFSLFTADSIQDLRGSGVLIRAQDNQVHLALPLKKSGAPGGDQWIDAGELQATFPKTADKEFYRIELPE